MDNKKPLAIFWHRRDLRVEDNAGLYNALKGPEEVLPIFIFDKNILDKLEDKDDRRVNFIHTYVAQVKAAYQKAGSDLFVHYGTPQEFWQKITEKFNIKAVYTNRDYEPYAQQRDKEIYELLKEKGIDFKGYKDHVIFEKNEVTKDDGKPYTVFTPYSKKWKAALTPDMLKPYPTKEYFSNLTKVTKHFPLPSLNEMGFEKKDYEYPSETAEKSIISKYGETRDIPSIKGTTRISVHLRFGTVSIREMAQKGLNTSEKWLNELIWRDFYQAIIYHFPYSAKTAFKPAYDNIEWEKNTEHYALWCKGLTGYPLVDAGMRELEATGFMHNRVRMVTASFFTKHLLLDYRLGEAWFARKLIDFELASNNGGWQWAASSGCDAAPYFRVFNPALQQDKFDPDLKYIKKWVPEYGTSKYPAPIVDHKFARERAIERYKEGLS
ncbi:MAG: cryptochrome/photolyase family protein [Luteibaculaceae bacterium]